MLVGHSITRRTSSDIDAMRVAGGVVAAMHAAIRDALAPGVSLVDLDAVARDVLADAGATSSFLGYHGFPATICASVNEVVVHGIPDRRRLAAGDIVSIDCGAIVDGWHGDAAFTAAVGDIDDTSRMLVDTAEQALADAIEQMQPGHHLSDIGAAVQTRVEGAGFGVVRGYTGHGIGREMHEDPAVPNFGRPGRGPRLEVGNVLAIEPMVAVGDPATTTLADGWTVVTVDGGRAAHVEHTVAVTDDGPRILTVARDAA